LQARDQIFSPPAFWRRLALLWTLIGAVVFLSFLGRAQIVSSHEARVALTAQSMARSGWPWAHASIDVPVVVLLKDETGSRLISHPSGETRSVNPWLVPVFQGEIRLQKPPLPYWCTALSFKLFGFGPAAARIVPAFLGLLSLGLMYQLCLRTTGARAAMIAMAAWTSSYFVIDEFRKAMADPYLAFFTLAAVVVWIESSSRSGRRGMFILLFYALLAGGALAKGPVILLHVCIALAAFAWCHRRRPRAPWILHIAGIALFAAIVLPWPIYVATHVPGALELWRFESIGEFADNQRNARPIWFYLPQLFLITLPWIACFIWGIVITARGKWLRSPAAFPLLWTILALGVFSMAHMKKNAYLLPLMPALVMLMSIGANRILALIRRRPQRARFWVFGHSGVAVFFAIATVGASIYVAPGWTSILAGALVIALAAIHLVASMKTRDAVVWFHTLAMTFAISSLVFISFVLAAQKNRKSATTQVTLLDSRRI
jgi:4-amino-4-deoxy-L-arabinose transferase-like glycosyltransferase